MKKIEYINNLYALYNALQDEIKTTSKNYNQEEKQIEKLEEAFDDAVHWQYRYRGLSHFELETFFNTKGLDSMSAKVEVLTIKEIKAIIYFLENYNLA